jgi:hypothetical protein
MSMPSSRIRFGPLSGAKLENAPVRSVSVAEEMIASGSIRSVMPKVGRNAGSEKPFPIRATSVNGASPGSACWNPDGFPPGRRPAVAPIPKPSSSP